MYTMRFLVCWLMSLLLLAGSAGSCKSPVASLDAGLRRDATAIDAGVCVDNACGGCATLDGEPGLRCGDDVGCGIWACESNGTVSCNRDGCPCSEAADCDDGTVCNGIETCDLVNGCESGTPLVCEGAEVCCSASCEEVIYSGGNAPGITVVRDATQACGIDANGGESILVTASAFGVPGTQDDNFIPGTFTVSNISIRDQAATERSTTGASLQGSIATCSSVGISSGSCDFVLTYDSSGAAIVFLELSFLVSYNVSEVTISQFVLTAL